MARPKYNFLPLLYAKKREQKHNAVQGEPEVWAVTAGIDVELGRLECLSSSLDFEDEPIVYR